MFKAALATRRCLVSADAFYEWKTMADGKQPYAIARRDGVPLAFAGVWEWWRAPDGNLVRTFAILTTSVTATMSVLHERMPVILEPDAWSTWLGQVEGDFAALMRPAADDVLHLWPVSRAVNGVRNNGAGNARFHQRFGRVTAEQRPSGCKSGLRRYSPDRTVQSGYVRTKKRQNTANFRPNDCPDRRPD